MNSISEYSYADCKNEVYMEAEPLMSDDISGSDILIDSDCDLNIKAETLIPYNFSGSDFYIKTESPITPNSSENANIEAYCCDGEIKEECSVLHKLHETALTDDDCEFYIKDESSIPDNFSGTDIPNDHNYAILWGNKIGSLTDNVFSVNSLCYPDSRSSRSSSHTVAVPNVTSSLSSSTLSGPKMFLTNSSVYSVMFHTTVVNVGTVPRIHIIPSLDQKASKVSNATVLQENSDKGKGIKKLASHYQQKFLPNCNEVVSGLMEDKEGNMVRQFPSGDLKKLLTFLNPLFCNQTSTVKWSLIQGMLFDQQCASELKCKYCFEVLRNLNDYVLHFESEHTYLGLEIMYPCDLCYNYVKPTMLTYIKHWIRHFTNCQFLDKCSPEPSALSTNVNIAIHPQTVMLDMNNLNQKPKPSSERYQTESNVGRNVDSYSNTEPYPYQCKVCSSKFPTPVHLIRHASTHKEKASIKRNGSVKPLTSGNAIRGHNTDISIKCYSCNVCHAFFYSRISFRQHMKQHLGQRDSLTSCKSPEVTTSTLLNGPATVVSSSNNRLPCSSIQSRIVRNAASNEQTQKFDKKEVLSNCNRKALISNLTSHYQKCQTTFSKHFQFSQGNMLRKFPKVEKMLFDIRCVSKLKCKYCFGVLGSLEEYKLHFESDHKYLGLELVYPCDLCQKYVKPTMISYIMHWIHHFSDSQFNEDILQDPVNQSESFKELSKQPVAAQISDQPIAVELNTDKAKPVDQLTDVPAVIDILPLANLKADELSIFEGVTDKCAVIDQITEKHLTIDQRADEYLLVNEVTCKGSMVDQKAQTDLIVNTIVMNEPPTIRQMLDTFPAVDQPVSTARPVDQKTVIPLTDKVIVVDEDTNRAKDDDDEMSQSPCCAKKCSRCSICSKGYISTYGYTSRRMTRHENYYDCNVCMKRGFLYMELVAHMDTHRNVAFRCLLCSWKFSTQKALDSHMVIHPSADPFLCPFCDLQFHTSDLRKSHIDDHRRQGNIQNRPQTDSEKRF